MKRKQLLLDILKIIVFISIFTYLILKTDLNLLISGLKNINYYYLVSSIFLSALVIYLISVRLRIILNLNQIQINPIKNYLINYYAKFIDNFFFGFLGGDGYKLFSIEGEKKKVIKSILLDRVTGLLILSIFAIPGVIIYLLNSEKYGGIIKINYKIILIGIVILALASFLLILKRDFLMRSIGETKRILLNKKLLFLAAIIQIMMILNIYLVFLALNWQVSLIDVFLFVPLINLIITLPISIKGYGFRELLIVVLFGISINEVLIFTIVNTAITLFHTSLGALIHTLFGRKIKS